MGKGSDKTRQLAPLCARMPTEIGECFPNQEEFKERWNPCQPVSAYFVAQFLCRLALAFGTWRMWGGLFF